MAGLGFLLGASGAAWGSAGCDAVNAGGFGHTITGHSYSDRPITDFSAGYTITFTITTSNATGQGIYSLQWWLSPTTPLLSLGTLTDGVFTRSHTVVDGGATSLTSVLRIQSTGGSETMTVVATCTPGASTDSDAGAPTDSDRLRALQVQGSSLAAQASGAALTGAVAAAIGDAFSNGGRPVAITPNGVRLNFASTEPKPAQPWRVLPDSRGDGRNTEPTFAQPWSVWADIRGNGWNDAGPGDLTGTQLNATAGVGYLLSPDMLVGVMAGYENFKYEGDTASGKLNGTGGTIGGYAAWQIAPMVRWDAMAGWSNVSYDADAGAASGSFTGSRWLASTGFTGTYNAETYVIESSARAFALWEDQEAWTDSLGAAQDARNFSAGRISVGSRVIAPWQISSALSASPYVGLYGDWGFSSDDAITAGVPDADITDGWSGRVSGGISLTTSGGGTLSLGGEYGGIGAGYQTWSANAGASWAF